MKRILYLTLAILLFATACTVTEVPPATVTTRTSATTTTCTATTTPTGNSTVVYITDTGECYHRRSCGSLWNSCHSITLNDACCLGYRACKRCSPP